MIIKSILDTDWYKLTMGQVVHFFYSGVKVRYKFINRGGTKFPDGFDKLVQEEVNKMSDLKLTLEERNWLASNPNIYLSYLDWLFTYEYDPKEVQISQKDGVLDITVEGNWERTIYWEVPLLAIISELYHKDCKIDMFDVNKKILLKNDILKFPYADFGTRRRFSYEVHDSIVSYSKLNRPYFLGTSNPYLAMKYDIPAIGTYAHEAVMALEVLETPFLANWAWLAKWKMVYGKQYNIALGDTLTTESFLKDLTPVWAHLLDGIRQDSGDPIEVGKMIVKRWEELRVNPKNKKIVFSDNLNPEKAKEIYDTFKDITNPIFGIGTNLTNDCGYPHLNMVIKLSEVYWGAYSKIVNKVLYSWKPVVKLSDDKRKWTGEKKVIEAIQKDLKI